MENDNDSVKWGAMSGSDSDTSDSDSMTICDVIDEYTINFKITTAMIVKEIKPNKK